MLRWHNTIAPALRGGLAVLQHELRALEEDLGLCAVCGATRPLPFSQRRRKQLESRPGPRAERLAA